MAKKKKWLRSCLFSFCFFFIPPVVFSASEMPPAVSCCVSLRGLASLKRTLTGCWINGCGINKGWGTICGFFFFFLWHPLCMMSFQNRFIECCLVKLLRHVCISGQWRCFMAFIQVCVWITHIFYFFLLAVFFLYTSYGGQQLSEYTSNLYLIPPWYLCFVKMQNQKNKH